MNTDVLHNGAFALALLIAALLLWMISFSARRRILQLITILIGLGFLVAAKQYDNADSNAKAATAQQQTDELMALQTSATKQDAEQLRLADAIQQLQQSVQAKDTELDALRRKSTAEAKEIAERLAELEVAARRAANEVAEIRGNLVTMREAVLFPTGDATLNCERRENLGKVVGYLKLRLAIDSKIKGIEVSGHTDSHYQGADAIGHAFNTDLSTRRAATVHAYLISAGVPPDRLLEPRGVGDAQPANFTEPQLEDVIRGSNLTIEQRQRNRRVEIRLVME